MDRITLHATRRTVTGKQVKALRREGKLPGVLYGHNFDPIPVTLDLRDASRSLQNLTSSSLITVELDGTENATLIREKQRDFIRGTLLHVDFQVVSLTEKIRAMVTIELTGVSPAVKDFNGVVVEGVTQIEVECFPQDLPQSITVDISRLKTIGNAVYVRDLAVPEKVELLTDTEEMVVLVTGGTTEAELTEAETVEGGAAEPEVIEKGKKEEEEEE